MTLRRKRKIGSKRVVIDDRPGVEKRQPERRCVVDKRKCSRSECGRGCYLLRAAGGAVALSVEQQEREIGVGQLPLLPDTGQPERRPCEYSGEWCTSPACRGAGYCIEQATMYEDHISGYWGQD